MAKLLIVYGTTEGHTRKIAGKIAEAARESGHTAHVIDASLHPSPFGYDAVVVAASLHQMRHQASVEHFVRENLRTLRDLPTAFFSVSLTAALPEPEHQAEAQACVDDFLHRTHWRPMTTFLVAGALLYTKYDFFKRLVLKHIARQYGRSTDTTRDHELTDWPKLWRDTETFLAYLPAPRPAEVEASLELAEAGSA